MAKVSLDTDDTEEQLLLVDGAEDKLEDVELEEEMEKFCGLL